MPNSKTCWSGPASRITKKHREISRNWLKSFQSSALIGKERELVDQVEDLAKGITTESWFKERLKYCFHLAKNFSKNPWVQFGIFLALFGLVFALVAETERNELVTVARAIAITCATSALTSDGIEKFVEGSDDFI